MTKKTQIVSQRKVLKLSASFFIASALLLSCKKETNIGDGLEDNSLTVHKTDTFTLLTYSELPDSVQTDETAVNLLGAYNDPVFGKVECGIVTELKLSSNNPQFKDSATAVLEVDSVVLSLRYTSINYYANIQELTFEVYEITDDLVRDDKDYYAFDSPTTTGSNLVLAGTETQTPDFVKDQIVGDLELPPHLRIHLDPSLGEDFITAAENGDLADDASFKDFFKGLYIKVDGSAMSTGQGMILYHVLENSISGLTIYYRNTGDDITKEYMFEFNSDGARYGDIKFDHTGTPTENIADDKTKGKEAFYLQGTSFRAVIEIPHLLSFYYDENGNYDPKIINKAELILPIQDFGPDPFHPSSNLLIAKIVDENNSEFTLDVSAGSFASSTVTYNQNNKEFRFIVTREIAGMLKGEREFKGFRIYSPSYYGSTIERVVFNGSHTTLKEKPRLEITYSEY